jgi:flagellar hook-basal body complex protein FliE
MASPTVAANAYANLARILDTGSPGKASEGEGPSFASVLKEAVGSVMEAGKKSDQQTVAETDVAVSTLVSVRDKVIQAYEDIMKMAI